MPFQPVLPPSTRLIFSAIWGGGLRASMLIAASAGQAGAADRRRVLEAALVPEIVETPADTKRRACADVGGEHFAVIADGLHDTHHPVLAQAELFTEIAVGAEYALQLRIVLFPLLVDVLAVTPSSSVVIRANSVHFTMSNHWSSPWRTIGPSG